MTLPDSQPHRVALYARVSTEDQAERQTVQAQLDFLRKYCDLHEIVVAGEYVDDGWSGALALEQRPDGRRLLDDASAGRFSVVLCYRLDRLGRSLKALLDAHDGLERLGVAIKSATEPFDTTSPMGTFLFQLLGSLAQLERATITERTAMGRNRVAGTGQYTGGPIPLGYDLDADRRLVPSARLVPSLGVSEAELVRDLFGRIASGESTLNRECGRLTTLGVPRRQRYGGQDGRVIERAGGWGISSLSTIIHNPVYKGGGQVRSRFGEVTRPAAPLVDPATWERAQEALGRNRSLSKKNAKNTYLLRGLIKCEGCGLGYVGMVSSGTRKYRCSSNAGRAASRPQGRCPSKILHADWLEGEVWQEVRRFVDDPGEAMDEARRQLRERMAETTTSEQRRKALLIELAGKETERERVLTLFRRGRVTTDEAEAQLDAIARESAQLRELAEALRAQEALVQAQEAHLADAGAMLARIRGRVDEIEAEDDQEAKRELIELLVPRITVASSVERDDGPRRRLGATVRLRLAFRSDSAVVSGTSWPGARRSRRSGWSWRSGGSTAASG